MFGLHRHNLREFRQIWEINVKSIELLTRKSGDMGLLLQLKIVTYWLQWGVNDMTWLWCGDLVVWWWPLWNGELVPVEPWLEPLLEPLWPARWGQLSFWWKGNLGTFRSHSSLGTFDFMRPLMSHCFAGMECLLIRENVNPSGGRSNWSCSSMWSRLSSSMWSRLSSSMWSRLRPRCFNHSLDLSPIPVLNLDFHRTDVENSTQSLSFSKQCHKIYLRHKLTEASPRWAFPRLDFGLISWTNLRIHGVAAPTNMEAADHSLPSVPQFNDHHHHAGITLEKSQQMQSMWIYLFLGSLFEDTF